MATSRRFTAVPSSDEIVVFDGIEPCPYIEGNAARMPLRLQLRYGGERFDALLAAGDRRVGQMLYRPTCPSCRECIDVRIPVADFTFSRSQARVWRRNADVEVVVRRPVVDAERLELFNRHKLERQLGSFPLDRDAYTGWLVRTCADTREVAFYVENRLVAVSIVDLGQDASSAVYTYFDPKESSRSLGTFAVLQGIVWAREQGLRYHYLGLYVEQNTHLRYKALFRPQERLIEGAWVPFPARPPAP